MALKDLTDEQIKFAYAYARCLDPVDALLSMGYGEASASVLAEDYMSSPDVIDAILIRLSAAKRGPALDRFTPEDLGITVNALLIKLKDVLSYIPPEPLPVVDKDGGTTYKEVTPYYKGGDKIKAIELLGKHIGMWTDKSGAMTNPNDKASNDFSRVFGTEERKELLDKMWEKAKGRLEKIKGGK